MARKKSLWSELQRERDRRARIAVAQQREERQLVRQLRQDSERAQRLADRADVAERKRQEQQAHEAGAAAARTMKAQLDGQVDELQALLTSRLAGPPLLTFAMLKQAPEVPPFDPGALGDAWPVPRWEDYAPPPPGTLSGLVGGKARYARAREAASETFQQALADHGQAEAERGRQLLARTMTGRSRPRKPRSASTTRRWTSWSAPSGQARRRRSRSSSARRSRNRSTQKASRASIRLPTGPIPASSSSSTGCRPQR